MQSQSNLVNMLCLKKKKEVEERDYLSVSNKSLCRDSTLNGHCCLGTSVNTVRALLERMENLLEPAHGHA